MGPKVNAYKEQKNGYKAFQALYNHYHTLGDPSKYAGTCLDKILRLSLTANIPGSLEMYLSNFEALVVKL